MKTMGVGLILAVVSPLAACAASAPLGPGEPDVTALPAEVTVNRSGGFAGVSDTVTIDPDGAWRYDGGESVEAGQLDEGLLSELVGLVTDPSLAVDERAPSGRQCADFFVYTVTVATEPEVSGQSDSCGNPPNEVFTEVVDLVSAATPLGE